MLLIYYTFINETLNLKTMATIPAKIQIRLVEGLKKFQPIVSVNSRRVVSPHVNHTHIARGS